MDPWAAQWTAAWRASSERFNQMRDLSFRVGPHGYIHGWIFVGAPGVGDRVFHPHHGHGTVTGLEGKHAAVKFDKGGEHRFEVTPGGGTAALQPRSLAGDAAHEHLGSPSLSKAQRDAVERYQGSLYHQMDAYLNTGDIHAADDEMGSHVISEAEMHKQIALLDSAFKAAPPTTKPMTVYRGMNVPDATPGATWTDKTPVSTSTDQAIGDQYASWAADAGPGAMTVRITVPAGSKALSMMNMLGGTHPQAVDEREVLLPRGSRFRVIAVSGNVVEVELLPHG